MISLAEFPVFRMETLTAERSFPNLSEHLGLVCFVVMKNCSLPRSTPVKDTEEYADGCIGLIQALDTFEQDRGEFSTHATPLIRNAIIDGMRDRGCRRKCYKETINMTDLPVVEQLKNDYEVETQQNGYFHLSKEQSRLMLAVCPNDTYQNKKDKRILWLHFFGRADRGMSYAEIGRKLGRTREAIRQAVRRGVELLRQRYLAELEEQNA